MKQIDVLETIGKGIAALQYIQRNILTQQNVEGIRDALAKIETFGEDAKTMLLQAKSFIEIIATDAGRARGFGLENKLDKSGVLLTYKEMKAALKDQTPTLKPEK